MPAPDAPNPDPSAPAEPAPTILRSLGQFVGHIVDSIKTDPDAPSAPPQPGAEPPPSQAVIVKHEVEDQTRQTPKGTVRVRRTVIEEVELDPRGSAGPDTPLPPVAE